MRTHHTGLLAAVVLSLAAAPAAALDKEVVADANKLVPKEGKGWEGTITLGANVSFGHAYQVVGTPAGQSWTIGANFAGELNYIKGMHDWRNSLGLLTTFSYGPPINKFVKSADKIVFDTIYYLHIPQVPWLGPFARFNLASTLFESSDYRATNTVYQVTDKSGVLGEKTSPRRQYFLTDSFNPLTLKESIGLFARPVALEPVELEFRLGIGAQEVFADGALAFEKVDADGVVQLKELSTFHQVGGEAMAGVQGAFYDKKVTYRVYGEALMPFYRTKRTGDTRSGVSMTNVELGAKLTFKLVDWASLVYEFKALRQPQLIDQFQVTNMLLLSFGWSWHKEEAAPAPAAAPAAK